MPTGRPEAPPGRPGPSTSLLDNVPAGILYMVLATFLFAVSSAIAKWQVAIYPVGEVMFFRSASSLLVCAAVVLPFTGLSVFATSRPGAHIARGLSQSISQTFTVIAFSLMPLAGAIAINFSAPLWAALAFGSVAEGARLADALGGVADRLQRRADRGEPRHRFASDRRAVRARQRHHVWQRDGRGARHDRNRIRRHAADVADGGDRDRSTRFLLAFGFRMPTAIDAAMLGFSGVANAVAQYAWTRSLLLAPTTAVSPFYYLMLVWAIGIGYFVWGDVPTVGLLVGSAIVVGSGLLLLWHEAKQKRGG